MIFLGAGHPDWKIVLPIDDFVTKSNCIVADIEN